MNTNYTLLNFTKTSSTNTSSSGSDDRKHDIRKFNNTVTLRKYNTAILKILAMADTYNLNKYTITQFLLGDATIANLRLTSCAADEMNLIQKNYGCTYTYASCCSREEYINKDLSTALKSILTYSFRDSNKKTIERLENLKQWFENDKEAAIAWDINQRTLDGTLVLNKMKDEKLTDTLLTGLIFKAPDNDKHIYDFSKIRVNACTFSSGTFIVEKGSDLKIQGTSKFENIICNKDLSILSISENAEIGILHGEGDGNLIKTIDKKAKIKTISGEISIETIRQLVNIDTIKDQAELSDCLDTSRIENMYGNSKIINLRNHASIGNMTDHASIKNTYDETFISEMNQNSQIYSMFNSSSVGAMHHNPENMDATPTIDTLHDNTHVKSYEYPCVIKHNLSISKIGDSAVKKLRAPSLVNLGNNGHITCK
jgi:hypothetical protein